MVFAHMNRKLGVFAAACTLALGLFGGVASAQPWEYEIYPDENDAMAQIIESVSGAETKTKGISYDVDNDGALEDIHLGYRIYEDGTPINAALCIDNVEKVQGLPDGMEESSLKLELLKLPNGCLFIHAYGYCGESINDGLDRLFKVKAVDGATDPEFAHSVTTVLDCYGNPYIGAEELVVKPGQTAVVKDDGAYGCVVIEGHGTLGSYQCESPTLIRFGQLTADEFFVGHDAAVEGVTVTNQSPCEDLVILKHFGPDHKIIYPEFGQKRLSL